MIILFLCIVYILIGAAVGSIYYYLQLKNNKYDDDVCYSVLIGLFWPCVAPFAFGLYYAKKLSKNK